MDLGPGDVFLVLKTAKEPSGSSLANQDLPQGQRDASRTQELLKIQVVVALVQCGVVCGVLETHMGMHLDWEPSPNDWTHNPCLCVCPASSFFLGGTWGFLHLHGHPCGLMPSWRCRAVPGPRSIRWVLRDFYMEPRTGPYGLVKSLMGEWRPIPMAPFMVHDYSTCWFLVLNRELGNEPERDLLQRKRQWMV